MEHVIDNKSYFQSQNMHDYLQVLSQTLLAMKSISLWLKLCHCCRDKHWLCSASQNLTESLLQVTSTQYQPDPDSLLLKILYFD